MPPGGARGPLPGPAMKLIERYFFRKMLGALVVTFLALSLTIWLTQALDAFDLVSDRGQSIITFFKVTGLIFPALITVIVPVAMMVATIYTLNQLNSESELVSVSASGGSSIVLLKPALVLGLIAMVGVGACTIFVTPITQLEGRKLNMEINANVVTSVIREGQFLQMAPKMTIQVRERAPNGVMSGIFVFDERDPQISTAYLARNGAVLTNGLGRFLVMQDGVIQRQATDTGQITAIEFQAYGLDLATLAGRDDLPYLQIGERSTASLFDPDPSDPIFQNSPNRLRAELHDRLTSPLYVLVFALVPIVALGQPRTARQGYGLPTLVAVSLATDIRGLGFVLVTLVRETPGVIPLLYILPLASIAVCVLLIVRNIRFNAPNWVLAYIDWLKRIGSRIAGRAAPAQA